MPNQLNLVLTRDLPIIDVLNTGSKPSSKLRFEDSYLLMIYGSVTTSYDLKINQAMPKPGTSLHGHARV